MQETLFHAGFRQNYFSLRDRMVTPKTKKGVLHMMITISSYYRRFLRIARRLVTDPRLRLPLRIAGYLLAGFGLSAASLGNKAQPLVLALLCVPLTGWLPALIALGASAGYWLFWGQAGLQGIVWTAVGLPLCVLVGKMRISRQSSLLMPALAALTVALTGLVFQAWWRDDTTIWMYLLRICMAFGATWLFAQALQQKDPMAQWGAGALGILALAQIAPLPWLDLGILAAGAAALLLPFPAVAMMGLALDLAQVTGVPMTAVLCLTFLARLTPRIPKWSQAILPGMIYLTVMRLCGHWDLLPLLPLLLGGLGSALLPKRVALPPHRGATGIAQVRLEMASGVMAQWEQLLLEVKDPPIDEQTILEKGVERACGSCPCRKGCKEIEQAKTLSPQLLHRPLCTLDDLNVNCKKRGRLMVELRRCQDQYRILKADRDRRREYHGAVIQQYRFMTEYLQDLADALPKKAEKLQQRFQPEIAVCSAGKEQKNGDRCTWFAGPELKYYLLLCDGMGTGEGAAEEARICVDMLRRLLMAGYPAPYALRSFNSLCVLRGVPGAVSIDLAEVCLDSGKTVIYKWGAAPSWLLLPTGAERIGTASTPPGLAVTETQESVERLSLRRGESLVLLSDGVAGEDAMARLQHMDRLSPGEMAAAILEIGREGLADDATAAVVRLKSVTVST